MQQHTADLIAGEEMEAAFLAADGESPVSAEAVRREDGWWEIPWQGNGTYSVE